MTTFGIPSSGQSVEQGSPGSVAPPWFTFWQNLWNATPGAKAGGTGALGSYAFISAGQLTNSLGADVPLNNTANYFDGPTVAQGTDGVWFASGTVTVVDTASAAAFYAKLWDGVTVIASAANWAVGGAPGQISLSGFISNPAGNIRISVRDVTTTHGFLWANATGNSKDCTLSAFRIG